MSYKKIDDGIQYAKKGITDALKLWLEEGNSPNQYDKDGWTPLLWAAVRGNSEAVKLLIDSGADSKLVHGASEALPIHLAGHSGDVETAKVLLDHSADEIDMVWDLNGHGILLQAAFYGHLTLADFLVKRGANTVITTSRGLGPMEMAQQFQNQAMQDILKPYDKTAELKAEYYQTYLDRISPSVSEKEKKQQGLSDQLVSVIENGLKSMIKNPDAANTTMEDVKELVEVKGADINRLGGILQQPPIVVTATGNNGFPSVAKAEQLRNAIAKYLLEKGADPTKCENHPMGVQTIIRAAVFNHMVILKMCAEYISPQQLTDAINEIPIVNGLTALHDTVLRASTSASDKFPGYLAQCKWLMDNGGKSDIEDFAGRTQKNIAENCKNEMYKEKLLEIL